MFLCWGNFNSVHEAKYVLTIQGKHVTKPTKHKTRPMETVAKLAEECMLTTQISMINYIPKKGNKKVNKIYFGELWEGNLKGETGNIVYYKFYIYIAISTIVKESGLTTLKSFHPTSKYIQILMQSTSRNLQQTFSHAHEPYTLKPDLNYINPNNGCS